MLIYFSEKKPCLMSALSSGDGVAVAVAVAVVAVVVVVVVLGG